jgi:hypothetical protein
MAYKKLTRRSYKIIKRNITKHDHRIHHIYHTHHILWQYHITNTPCKNKLDASNLLIAYFTWLMGATHKNSSYLRKATTLILWLLISVVNPMTTIVRETGIHQPHVWNKPDVKCGAGLANEVA